MKGRQSSKTMRNIITVNDIRFTKFFYVWCDIDGQGLKWEMASRNIRSIIFYKSGDEETFEDTVDHYLDYPVFLIEEPEPLGNPCGISDE